MYSSLYKKCSLFKFMLFILINTCLGQAMTGNYHRFVEAVTKMIQPDTTSPAKPSQPEQYLVHIYEKNESICIGAYIKGFNNFHVVTTASCVINVKMPLLRAHMRTANQTQLIRTVKELLVHPQYRHNKVAFNIALLKLEKNFAPYGIPGIIDTSNQLHTNCLLYHLFVDILNKEKTRMVSCPKLSVNVTAFACLKALEAVCLRDCKFIAVCEGKLCGIVVEELSCEVDLTYVVYTFQYFESFITTGKDPEITQPEKEDEEPNYDSDDDDESGTKVFRGDHFAYLTLLYYILHIY